MNFKTTYLLFGILLGMAGVFLLAQVFGTRNKDQQTYLVPSLHDAVSPTRADDIESIEIERTEPTKEKLHFYRDAQGVWQSKTPMVRVNTMQVNRIADQIINAKHEMDNDSGKNLSSYGLDSPKISVTIRRKESQKEWRVNLGQEAGTGDRAVVYVSTSDDPKDVQTVTKRDLDLLYKSLVDFRSKDLVAESQFDIQSASLQLPKKELVSLEKGSDQKWKFVKPPYGEAEYDGEPPGPATPGQEPKITGVNGLLTAIANLKVENDADFGTIEASDKELADAGLEADKPEKLRIEVKTQKGSAKEALTQVLLIGKKADEKGDKLYARLASEKNIVKIPAKKVDSILHIVENPSPLRNHNLVALDTQKTDAIDVRLSDKETLKLRHPDNSQWKIFEAGKAQLADDQVVRDLLTALTEKHLIKDFPESARTDADLSFDRPSCVVSIWTEGLKKDEKKEEKKDDTKKEEKKDDKAKEEEQEQVKDAKKAEDKKDEKKDVKKDEKPKEEKKDDKKEVKKEEKKEEPKDAEPALKDEKPTIKLTFGRRDKDLVYVRRESGGEVLRAAVPASLLDRLTQGKLAYLDRRLPTFAMNANISKLTLSHGKEPIELVKDDKSTPAGWKLTGPKEVAGRNADADRVERVINDLRGIMAEKYVAEKPSENMLENYGLKSPSTKATIAIDKGDKKTEEFVYQFGKETDDKTAYFAHMTGSDFIFLVRKGIVDDLQGDLQDPTVLKFTADKLKGMKLTGWQDVAISPVTLDLERKSNTSWVAKSPANFEVDATQAESFVGSLINLRAERFVGKGSKPDYKLDTKDGALEIVLTIEGEKEPVTLIIGAPTASDGYYARCSKLPGEIVVLPKGSFDKVKSKPAYFKK